MKKLGRSTVFVLVLGLVCPVLWSVSGFANELPKGIPLTMARFSPTGISWEPQIQHDGVVLTVSGVGDIVFAEEFKAGDAPSMSLFDQHGNPLPDGLYKYELRFVPVISDNVRQYLAAFQESEVRSLYVSDLVSEGLLPKEALVQSGTFRVLNKRIVVPSGSEEEEGLKQSTLGSTEVVPLDQVVYDDQIVTGSLCVGADCATDGSENFGYDTIKLKENNLQIYFEDTSTGSFPTNDWRIVVNDTTSGGANYFAVQDSTAGRTPFKIEANAPNNSLYIDDSGRIGRKTSTPYTELHMVDGDSPTIRLDQDVSFGWTPQAWDLVGNETNFFIRDVTGGSALPFRIQAGAPSNSFSIKSDGRIGIGTWSPSQDVDILLRNTSLIQLSNTESNATIKAARMVVRHYNNNTEEPVYLFGAASTSTNNFVALGGGSPLGNAATQIDLFTAENTTTPVGTPRLTIIGNGYVGIGTQSPSYPLEMAGGAYTDGSSWIDGSSREYKENIEVLSTEEALETIKELNPVKYAYKTDRREKRVGFIAEDVPELVSIRDRKGLSSMDIVAVLTKVVQEQQKTMQEQQKTISVLSEKVAELEGALQQRGNLAGLSDFAHENIR